jgi:iron(III) transport system substrate-binding protein
MFMLGWFLFVGCVPRPESSVVVYSASDREYATPILDGFDRQMPGTEVIRQFDIESSKTLGLVTRIEQERNRPRCDVFWNNEIIHTIRLQKQGLLASRRWKVPDSWPTPYRARVLLINKSKLTDPTTWPKSIFDLADERWNHRCGMAYPVYGTTSTHMAVLASHSISLDASDTSVKQFVSNGRLDWQAWAKHVSKNAVILAGNKQVALSVSRGDLDWGLTDTDDAVIEKESGQPVEIVFPDQFSRGFGTLFIPNSIAVIQGAPHPAGAAALADYLVSEKIESRLTMGNSAQFPVWPNAQEKPRLLKDQTVRWADVDFEKAAQAWPTTQEFLKSAFGSN